VGSRSGAAGLNPRGEGATFLTRRGSALKTWPQREHLKVGFSAGSTLGSIRYRVRQLVHWISIIAPLPRQLPLD
jgi:hypothetical protein